MNHILQKPCTIVLGGSFDPVHKGHVALAEHFAKLLHPAVLRIVPAGNPWQKEALHASAAQRVAMLRLAFAQASVPLTIDLQEIERSGASYSIDTLRAVRAELGPDASIAFLMGADQLQQLNSWKDWRQLFDVAHICVAARPGFALDALPPEVAQECARRAGTPEKIRSTPHGSIHIAEGIAVDVSSTAIRAALKRGERAGAPIPAAVLDYIKFQHLYQN